MIRKTSSILAGFAAIAVAASVVAPASADTDRFHDKKNDVRGQVDIRGVRVDNTGRWIDIRTHHRNLTYGPHAPGLGASVYIDTIRKRRGPEFIIAGPVGSDGDYHLSKMHGWRKFGKPLRCRVTFRVNYKRDVIRFAAKRGCLAHAYRYPIGRIRVSTRISQGQRDHTGSLVDWAPRKRRYFGWVKRS